MRQKPTWDKTEYKHERVTKNVYDPEHGMGANVRGHWADREPHMSIETAQYLAKFGEFDDVTDNALPLVQSDVRVDPVAGAHGKYKHIVRVDSECGCGNEYAIETNHAGPARGHKKECLLCGSILEKVAP